MAKSSVEADAPAKKPHKRAAKAEDGPTEVDALEKEKPTGKAKTKRAKDVGASKIVAVEPQVEVDVVEIEATKATASNKGKAAKEKPKATETKAMEPASSKKPTKARAGKAKKDTEEASASKQLTDSLETAIRVAPKEGQDDGMPSIEEASQNLLEAAKDKATGAFKKAEAIVVEQPAQKKEPKGKKRKGAEETDPPATTIEGDPVASATATKKQKKSKATAGNAVTSIRDRVSSFLSTIGDAVGAKSIADDLPGLAEDAVEAKAEDKKKDKSKASGKKGKGKVEAPVPEANGDDEDEDEWEPDDQTADLIKGFESDEEDQDSGDEGFKDGKSLPKPPRRKDLAKKLKEANSGSNESDESGVIYVGRIPHGFHEYQMKSYFSQFGGT